MADKKEKGKRSRVVKVIKTKTKLCLESKKEANKIIDIIAFCENEETEVLLACIQSFHKLFVHFLTSGEMYLDKYLPDPVYTTGLSKEELYKLWLTERYREAIKKLLVLLSHADNNVQELALCTLMKFVEVEGQNPIRKTPVSASGFPSSVFQSIIKSLCSKHTDQQHLIERFQEYTEFDDVKYHLMSVLKSDIKEKLNKHTKSMTDLYLNNVFCFLDHLKFSTTDTEKLLTNHMVPLSDGKEWEETNVKAHKKIFTNVWRTYLEFKLPTSLYRKVLIIIHDKVIPYMTSPILLSDFLTDSYNIGGAIGLLALNGLFVLVHRYNLDYPDFYGKLYALFEPSVFHAKYRARFFYLADLFLSSTHLPAYLVAAFAKKLGRIALTAPPSGLTVAIPFIYNLIGRHPNCKVLLHRPDRPKDVTEDPYDADEPDPAKCHAMDSCLWELKTLQSHYNPEVSRAAQKMENQQLIGQQTDLSELFETSYDDLFDKEVKKKMKLLPVNFDVPKGILNSKGDRLSLCWRLE